MLSTPSRSPTTPRTPQSLNFDDRWKANVRKDVERSLEGMVQEARETRDLKLETALDDDDRKRIEDDYRSTMENMRIIAQEEFASRLRQEHAKHNTDGRTTPLPVSVLQEQQWILDNIKARDGEQSPFPSSPAVSTVSDPARRPPWRGIPESTPEMDEPLTTPSASEQGESVDGTTEDDESEDGQDAAYPPRPPPAPNPPSLVRHRSSSQHAHRPFPPVPPDHIPDRDDDDPDESSDEEGPSHPFAHHRQQRRHSNTRSPFPNNLDFRRPMPARTPEPSGISRTLQRANSQPQNVPPPRRGSLNGPTPGLPPATLGRSGSLSMDHARAAERVGGPNTPSPIDRERQPSDASWTAGAPRRDRYTSGSMSQSARPELSQAFNVPTGTSPRREPVYAPAPAVGRPIPVARPPLPDDARFSTSSSPGSRVLYGPQRSPDDIRGGVPIPRGQFTPDEARGPGSYVGSSLRSRASTQDLAHPSHRRHDSGSLHRMSAVDMSDAEEEEEEGSDDAVGALDDHRSVRSARSYSSFKNYEMQAMHESARALEEEARRRGEEVQKKEAEVRQREEDARRKEDEIKRKETEARSKAEELRKLEETSRRRDEDIRKREAALRRREEDFAKREVEANARPRSSGRRRRTRRRRTSGGGRWRWRSSGCRRTVGRSRTSGRRRRTSGWPRTIC
ncbi:hypothetical protein OF83DRAFT_297852 [Amylostereum chailletii]|nr:hypothetical protein OF83DRAFT_297852 [Amylostereum chailletii]